MYLDEYASDNQTNITNPYYECMCLYYLVHVSFVASIYKGSTPEAEAWSNSNRFRIELYF